MEIVISIASKIGEALVTPIGREFGYLIYYNTNLKNLKDEVRKLFQKKDEVQKLVDTAETNGEDIKVDVLSWLESVNDEIIQKVKPFEDEINMKMGCLYRWSLSRKAYKIRESVIQLQKEGTFDTVAHPTPSPNIWSTFPEGFKNFESRVTCIKKVMEALKSEEVRIIGICGMGGVGKTTMVKEIIKRLAGLMLFDKIVMAVVSQSPNIENIQQEIADALGLRYDEATESGRARRLYARLTEINKIMIVLDDIWTELDFEAIGLPHGHAHEGCKILLTSRNLDVCKLMGSQEPFTIPVLTTEESLELFREMVGESMADPDLCEIAKELVNECGGLPIAIVTVAKALEKKMKYEWDDALKQLRMPHSEDIYGMDSKVYSSIKWSYDRLESKEAKSCLLLCCLFPEDYDIPIEYLVRYGWGRGYFRNIETLEDARNRVHSLVEHLRRRFLLLDSERKGCTKMHDVVHDVAILIASEDTHGFFIRSDAEKKGLLKMATYDRYSTISLIQAEIQELPVGFECPKLELLQFVRGTCSEDVMESMCKGTKELKVLAVLNMGSSSLLSRSLGAPKNLQMLCLEDCKLWRYMPDAIGGLQNLEILSYRGSNIRELPSEIGLLKQLRLLDTTDCSVLGEIPHGLLSGLCSLEELYMGNSFNRWEPAVGSGDRGRASLAEVMSLSDHLKVSVIDIRDADLLTKDMVLKNQTMKFHIFIGLCKPWKRHGYVSHGFENKLEISSTDAMKFIESGAGRLLWMKSIDLCLTGVKNLKYALNELSKEGFQHLKALTIELDEDIEYLLDGSTQHTAFPHLQSLPSFSNLRSLEFKDCRILKYVFSLSIARNLVQLQSLVIRFCGEMEEIVSKEWREDEKTADMKAFPKLTELTLDSLPRFVGFYKASKSNHEVTTPKDELMNNSLSDNDKRRGTSYDEHPSATTFDTALFPPMRLLWLQNLEKVSLRSTSKEVAAEVVFDLDGHVVKDGPAFSQLRKLELIGIYGLKHLWKNIPCGFRGFQNLRDLSVVNCPSLKYAFSGLIARLLVNLEELHMVFCEEMETIVRVREENEEEETAGLILFPKLNMFKLCGLEKLESLCPDASSCFLWSSTKHMQVYNCPKLKTLGSVIPQIKRVENNIENPPIHSSPAHTSTRSPGRGCTPYAFCSMTKSSSTADAHRRVEILPRPVVEEVITPLHVDDSNDNDNLELLEVENCKSLEVIFQLKAPTLEESQHVQAFNKLREVKLESLPMLMHAWEMGSQHITGFGKLRLLEVNDCNKLRYLFTSSIAKLLVSLEKVEVTDCEEMEVLVKTETDERPDDEAITFPQLSSITLVDLPNLKCFCAEPNYTLKLPCLVELKLLRCPDFKMFASKVIDTHRVKVYTEWKASERMGDLNTTTEYIYYKGFIPVHIKLEESEWMEDLNRTVRNIYEKQKGKELAM